MLGWVVAVAALGASATAVAQTEVAPPPSAPPAAEAIATPAADESPTRRPTRRPTRVPSATPTATAADTATATAVPSLTPTRRPSATATAVPPSPSATPVRAAAFGIGARNAALPLALGGGLVVLGIAIGALLGGAAAYAARRRARRTLATAMLLELRRLDAVLRRVVELDSPTSFPSLEHPIIEAALRDLTLFRTDSAARVAQFHGALRGIQHEIGDYRDNPLRWAGRLGELNQLIKGRAAAACRAVPLLLKALEREGGAAPPSLHDTPARPAATTPSGLPPPPFGPGDADDWTM